MDEAARRAPVRGVSARKRVIRLQAIEKSVESSRSIQKNGAGEGIESSSPAPTLYPVQALQPVLQHHRKCQYASVTYCVTYHSAFQQQPSDP
jgi:hypothetical protein